MSQEGGQESKDFFRRFRSDIASEFNKQCVRAKEQDWWTLSKMGVVFSVGLIISSGFVFTILQTISVIQDTDTALLVSVASLAATLGSYLFYIVASAFLAAVAGAVSVATGNENVILLSAKRNRYFVHLGKLVVGFLLFVGYYQYLFRNTNGYFIQNMAIIMALTGFMLLPFALLTWGAIGLHKEWTSLPENQSQTE